MSQAWVNFDGDAAVNEVGLFSDLAEDIGCVTNVGGGQLADSGFNVDLAEFLKLCIVWANLAQSLLEDGWVGGNANNILISNQILQRAGLNAGTGQIVQPNRNAGIAGALRCFSHVISLTLCSTNWGTSVFWRFYKKQRLMSNQR
ncbi:hypothetical protein GV51_0771 [Gardnerella vaginalis 5-1]|nr:hypothetical protein GV51_0771 [Gardnerella vaginalis 5-1]